jgi:hypothetical protein
MVGCGASGHPAVREFVATDAQNGQSIEVHAGDTVRVTLSSTAWSISGSSDSTVLEQAGLQVVSPASLGACYPGENCGTTYAIYRAIKVGTATVDASRVSCGEARMCVGPERSYQVTVVVT